MNMKIELGALGQVYSKPGLLLRSDEGTGSYFLLTDFFFYFFYCLN